MIQVTCAIIMDKEGVLVTRRSQQMSHPLKWEFPGGKVKEGEKPVVCIHREIREELGIEISVERLLPSVTFSYESDSIELIPFICQHLEGVIELAEHSEFRWVPVEELEQLDWLDADVKVVRTLLENL
jgi:8-oxo-dGTP diphosphatase